jgi:hypothetical protein
MYKVHIETVVLGLLISRALGNELELRQSFGLGFDLELV